MNRLPLLVSGILIFIAFASLVILENRRPLRGATESRFRRLLRNIGIGGIGAATMLLAEWPVIFPLAERHEHRQQGPRGPLAAQDLVRVGGGHRSDHPPLQQVGHRHSDGQGLGRAVFRGAAAQRLGDRQGRKQ